MTMVGGIYKYENRVKFLVFSVSKKKRNNGIYDEIYRAVILSGNFLGKGPFGRFSFQAMSHFSKTAILVCAPKKRK